MNFLTDFDKNYDILIIMRTILRVLVIEGIYSNE